ncbi:MAG: beta-N-acetylhexosaminidase [Thermodesulfobacteriota bacterium]|nr:beta-N-acetylhexosaminidase [Thermodesulfobacteriota bacterium]
MRNNPIESLGQLFMIGFPGTDLDVETQELIYRYGIGNFILFRRNVADPLQVARLCQDLKKACRDRGLPLPLISIDQEGGPVARLKPPFTQFPGAAGIARAADPAAEARRFADITARELNLIGCNMNFAPVMDLDVPGTDRIMEGRVFGSDPELVGHLGGIIIEGLQKEGILATAKHFPGIGGVKLDPHQDLPVMDTPLSELEKRELVPFQKAIVARVAAVMTAHVIYPDVDPDLPATLSRNFLMDILRYKMGFDGLVISDDLEMGAIERHFSLEESATLSLMAGTDIILICHEKEKIVRAFEAVRAFVEKDREGRMRLEESLRRVMAAKECYGITKNEFNKAAIKEYFKR